MRRPLLALLLFAAAPAGAAVLREPYGATASGQPVERYTITNANGAYVRILTYGGVVTELAVPDRGGRVASVILALAGLAAYEARPNFSSLIGRVANRTSGGGFTLDGTRYDIASAKDGISSHGGPGGFSARVWAARAGRNAVTLSLLSPDGDNGYPGALSVRVTYTLTRDNALRIDYRATTTRPTLVNLTNHMFFNLSGGPDIRGERLRIDAAAYLPVDARKLPTGTVAPVAGTAFDLRAPVTLGDRIDLPALAATKGYDHNFVLAGQGGRLSVAARAEDPASGRTMTVETTEPGVQFYTAGAFDGSLRGAAGPLGRAAGYALETQHFPDSANHPDFPSTVLRPGQVFRSTTIYRFGVGR